MFFSRFTHPRPIFRMDLDQYAPNDAGVLVPTTGSGQLPEYEERARESFVRGLVIGTAYGDEGKGKIVDFLMSDADAAVRFQGGHNAGHTVKVGDKVFDLHIIPSGLVYDGKEGIIARTCVLGVDLPKLRSRTPEISKTNGRVLWEFFQNTSKGEFICTHSLDELIKRKENTGTPLRGGLVPEIEQLESKGINTRGRLFIAEDVTLIGYHHILIDAFLEQSREFQGLRPIGSTGSGISPAYAATPLRYNISLGTALRNPDEYFQSMRAEWMPYARFFPCISIDILIEKQKEQIEKVRALYREGKIDIGDERVKIDEYRRQKKTLVGEGAQGMLISSEHSIYGTASTPNVLSLCEATGISPEEIANLFITLKLPPSSVGTRPLQFIKYVESAALAQLRTKYQEFGVSTGRPRDIMKISLIEIAQAVRLILLGTPKILGERIIPVINRVDGLSDFASLTKGQIPMITGFHYPRPDLLQLVEKADSIVFAGQNFSDNITPTGLLNNYPSRGDWSSDYMFRTSPNGVNERTIFGDFGVSEGSIGLGVHMVVRNILSAIYPSNQPREAILGTSPDRSGLVLVQGISPYR